MPLNCLPLGMQVAGKAHTPHTIGTTTSNRPPRYSELLCIIFQRAHCNTPLATRDHGNPQHNTNIFTPHNLGLRLHHPRPCRHCMCSHSAAIPTPTL
jgi:hypothetical protein